MESLNEHLILENQLCFSIYEASSQFNKLYTKALQSFGLTYTQYLALLVLWETDGMTIKEVGERLHLGTGTLTPMIKRMEANGWLKKERSTTDERKVAVFLLPKAHDEKQAIMEKIAGEVQSCNIEFEKYETLMKQLHLLREKLSEQNDQLK